MDSPRGDRRRRNDDPLDRLKRLAPEDIDRDVLSDVLHELRVHQEELSAQNNQLIETQHALEESRDRYVDLYDFAPIGYMTMDADGMIHEVNLTGASLLGKQRAHIVGLPFVVFVATADRQRFTEHLRQCRDADSTDSDIELRLNTEAQPSVQLVTRRRRSDGSSRMTFVSALIDVTARRQLEQEHRQAEEARDKLSRDREMARARADAKDNFLAMLSHELRTPLTPIMATMSDSRLISLAPEPLLGALQVVRRNLALEVRLIDDLLDVTRISRNRLILAKERLDMRQVVKDVTDMLSDEIRAHGVDVVTMLDASAYLVIGDPTRLRQVLWNLLGNAIKFTPPGGRVTVTLSNVPSGSIQVTVTDTGEGMDDAVLSAINEPQGTRELPVYSTSGLGLGLSICRGVVAAHGGTLRAMSHGRGRGSTFVVQIPIAAHLEQWNEPSGSVAPSPGKQTPPRRILLVEDHADSADTLSQLLMFHDYSVSVARTVAAALAMDAEQEFDLLISDIRLPDGSGLDLMRRLRASRPLRGIAISGFGTDEDRDRSREAGYDVHLTKPVDFNRLLDAITQVAGPPPAGSPTSPI